MTQPLTVVQLLPALHSGGVERGTLEIARALVAAGHRSVVISHGGRLVDALQAAGSEHITLPIHRKSLSSLLQVRPLRALLRRLGADVVHARSRVPAWLTRLALARLPQAQRPAYVTTVHGLYSVNRYSRVMTQADRVIVVSDTARRYVLDNYPDCPPQRLQLIYRGVTPDEFPRGYQPDAAWRAAWQQAFPQLQGKRVLTLPGRITRLKGHEQFIQLIAQLRADDVPIHGLIVGGAEAKKQAYWDELRARVSSAGLQDDITFTGLRSDIREVLAVSDVVLSLSNQAESFGRTTLEALALGVPVVGWAFGGVGDILARMYPEGAVPRGDSAALLARVQALLSGPADGAAPSGPGALPDDFKLDTMCQRTLALYAELAQARRARQSV